MAAMKIYKIQNNEGLFSSGGSSPKFTKRGKTWGEKRHVKSHLRMMKTYGLLETYDDCHVVEYEITHDPNKIEVDDFMRK